MVVEDLGVVTVISDHRWRLSCTPTVMSCVWLLPRYLSAAATIFVPGDFNNANFYVPIFCQLQVKCKKKQISFQKLSKFQLLFSWIVGKST